MVFLLFLGGSTVAQTVPPLVHYQGRLLDDTGAPMTTGTYELRFNLYEDATTLERIWGPQVFPTVHVANGYFDLMLGPEDENDPARSLAGVFAGGERYLQVTFDGGDGTTKLLPRQRLLSTAYALRTTHEMPVGAIMPFAGPASKVPAGWMMCDGQELLVADHEQLHAAIGDTWGPAASDHFKLPDLQGYFVCGAAAAKNGETKAAPVGHADTDVIQDHWHDLSDHTHSISTGDEGLHARVTFYKYQSDYYGKKAEVTLDPGSRGWPVTGVFTSITVTDNAINPFLRSSTGTDIRGEVAGPSVNESGSETEIAPGEPGSFSETRPENAYVSFIVKCR